MCAIVGYIGDKKCRQFILDGLTRLEYRGYDSAGVVFFDAKHKHFSYQKVTGSVSQLNKPLEGEPCDGFVGMGHSRWATHGGVTESNAHPHFNCDESVAVVHNGIIESFEEIRAELIKNNHEFYSATDTEVIAHFFGVLIRQGLSLSEALVVFMAKFEGAYALVIMLEEHPDKLLLVRRRSPLVVGMGKGEMFVASDFMAFSDKTSDVCFLPDNTFAIMTKDGIDLYDSAGVSVKADVKKVDSVYAQIEKQGFEHFMLKEIYEQKRAILRTISFCKLIGSDSFGSRKEAHTTECNDALWQQLGTTKLQIKKLHSLNLIAAGTSWHAARIAQFFFEIVCKIPTRIYLASEFRYMPFFPESDSLYIFISQSGETADILQAMRGLADYGVPTIGITNVATSTLVREANGFIPTQAGPEIAVASTKAFSTQIATLYWLAHRIAIEKNLIDWHAMHAAEDNLLVAAEILEATIETYKLKITQELAPFYAKFERFIFLGRHLSYPFAMEAALKLKEISYIFSQCYPAGELKHGPIALVDEKTPIVLFSVLDPEIYQKILSNAQEVKARNGHLLVFAFEDQKDLIKLADFAFVIPKVTPLLAPLAMTGLMQFLVYKITCELNRPIDKPRNLAKSVTVE